MALRVLTEQDLEFFHENGYLVVPKVVPQKNLDTLISVLYDFLGMDPEDSTTWYTTKRQGGSLVYLHQHQAIWDNRQEPRVHAAFADILGTEKLWVSMDRAAMKPPIDARFPEYDDRGFVHWDLDTAKPLPTDIHLQGVLALTETTPEMGGFHCVPGFHKNLAEWIAEQPADRNPRFPDLARLPEGMKVTPIPMQAGDLVIWDVRLAHGNGRNTGTRPRLAQYITMGRTRDDEAARQERISFWQERKAPTFWEREIPEMYRGRAAENLPAELTALGRKLLGIDLW
jgi:hypothetical protein